MTTHFYNIGENVWTWFDGVDRDFTDVRFPDWTEADAQRESEATQTETCEHTFDRLYVCRDCGVTEVEA